MISGNDIKKCIVALNPSVLGPRWNYLERNLREELHDVIEKDTRGFSTYGLFVAAAEYGNKYIHEVYKNFEEGYEIAYSLDDEIAIFPNILLVYFLALLYKEYMPVKTNVRINVSGENIMHEISMIRHEIQAAARSFTNVENVRVVCPTVYNDPNIITINGTKWWAPWSVKDV